MAAANTEVLANYREQKKNLDKLAGAARKQMQARFTELLTEAAGIQADFKADFGVNPEVPAAVKTFTLSDGKKKPEVATDAVANGKKIGGLRRSLNAANKNGAVARAAELTTQIQALGGTVEADDKGTPVEPAVDAVDEEVDLSEGAPLAAAAGAEQDTSAWL